MKKVKVALVCMVFAAGAILCSDVFAQRGVNAADDAAKVARASLTDRPGRNSSQIGWLDQVVDIINMDDAASKENSKTKDE